MEKVVLCVDGALGLKLVESVEKEAQWETTVVFTGKPLGPCKSPVRDVDVSDSKTLELALAGAQVCIIATETDLADPLGKNKEGNAERGNDGATKLTTLQLPTPTSRRKV